MEKIFYVPTPEEEFYQRIGKAVYSEFMRNAFPMPGQKETTQWLNHSEAAAYLKKSPAALYQLSASRQVKFTKRGKQNYYRPEDLDIYMEAGLLKTSAEILKEVQLRPQRNYSLTKTK